MSRPSPTLPNPNVDIKTGKPLRQRDSGLPSRSTWAVLAALVVCGCVSWLIVVGGGILGWWQSAGMLLFGSIEWFMWHWTTIWQVLVLWMLVAISGRLRRP